MPLTPAFLIMTYRLPEQIVRLTQRLARMFPGAPLLVHHDATQFSLRGLQFPSTVEIAEVAGPRRWGSYDLVEDMLHGYRMLLARTPRADVIIQLSGQCYPIKPAAQILNFFEQHPAEARPDAWRDAWIDALPVELNPAKPGYDAEAVRRYFPAHGASALGRWRAVRRSPFVKSTGGGLRCFKGSAWFALGRRAAERLLAYDAAHPAVAAYFRTRPVPDEAYPQSILCSDPTLTISPFPLHHIRWPAGSPNPAVLGSVDWDALMKTSYLFARKFDESQQPGLLDRIDAELLQL